MSAPITAIIVSRGDHPLHEILASIPDYWDSAVWDNGAGKLTRYGAKRSYRAQWSGSDRGLFRDLAVYGRYEAIGHVDGNVIVVQDDDCVLAPETFDGLVAAYKPGHVVCNMPQRFRDTGFYDDHALVGFGAIFDRRLPERAFDKLAEYIARDDCEVEDAADSFRRTCDIAFTALTPRILVDLPYTDLPWASAPNRMWKQPDHVGERTRMLELVRAVRDA